MPLDHYVSQVHLKQFYSPALGERMHATKKSDLQSFQCNSRSVCRVEDGSTNAYLRNNRVIEDFLRTVEPNYERALGRLRDDAIDIETIATLSGFAAYVTSCAPAAMRIHANSLSATVVSAGAVLDRLGLLPRAPAELGNKLLTQLLADETVRIDVDKKFPQAIGINTIVGRQSLWGNSTWEILHNDDSSTPFFSSDYPVALEERDSLVANWIVPLAPTLAIRILPDLTLSGTAPDLEFRKFRSRRRRLSRSDIIAVNRLIVRCAEDLVFYRDDHAWVGDFIARNRDYRIETIVRRVPKASGFLNISTQRVVPFSRTR